MAMSLSVLYSCCAGLDVHKKTVVACVLLTAPTGKVSKQVRTFPTTTAQLHSMRDWLSGLGVTHVAMESTGVYWRPIFNVLEGSVQVILVNAQHMKAVPGRKTDIRDSEWLADLLRHGLLTASFIPPQPVRDLRELTPYRTTPRPGTRPRGQPGAAGARERQSQAGGGGDRRARQERPGPA